MTISTALRPSARAALSALIDYAGLFPPAELNVEDARREYRVARAGPHAWMLGRFIVPASRLAASPSSLDGPFSAIADGATNLAAVRELLERDARVEALEIPPGTDLDGLRDALGAASVPIFVEVSAEAARTSLMSELARRGYRAKLRCGGLTERAFPGVDEVATFIAEAQSAGVPFKATAGLHHPVRHRDAATGFMMHGFLNLLTAAALASRGDCDALVRVVAEEDPAAFAFEDDCLRWRDERMDTSLLEETRRRGFVAYGSCSFSEPIEDLTALGMLSTR